MPQIAQTIREKALKLGYENCGIIPVAAMADFEEKVNQRIASVPKGEEQFGKFRELAHPQTNFPWAKAILVLINRYSGYDVPPVLGDSFAKAYLFDERLDEQSPGFHRREQMRAHLDTLGIQHADEPKFGLTGLRWAAEKAGLGTVRRNNFFYTPNGSYVFIEGFLIDRALEWVQEMKAKPCPPGCTKCQDACPTKSLRGPNTMILASCVSFQTSLSANVPGLGMPTATMVEQIGQHLYGCDACQDACPFNHRRWPGGEAFPGLAELLPMMRPERIMEMSYDEIAATLGRKFWYVLPENLWKWKLNALTVMHNAHDSHYLPAMRLGLTDPVEAVREFAQWTIDNGQGTM